MFWTYRFNMNLNSFIFTYFFFQVILTCFTNYSDIFLFLNYCILCIPTEEEKSRTSKRDEKTTIK
jgi:hypothetical protein